MHNPETNCDDGRLSQTNKIENNKKISHLIQSGRYNNMIPPPPPPPMPQNPGHSSLLINNTYTIKRELRNNHHFLAQSNNNNNETNSLNLINHNTKLKKKANIDKSNRQSKNYSNINQFDNLNNLTNFNLNNSNNLNNYNQTTNYQTDNEDNQEINSSLPDFQNYSIQQIEMQPTHSNNFFSLPYHHANFNQFNNQETCVKYPNQPQTSLTVDRHNLNQRNCVNNNCHSSNHKKESSFLNHQQDFNQQADFNGPNGCLSNSIEDLRNEASSKQQQIIVDDRTLQPNLVSALRSSISSEKQRLYKEQLRNELAVKLRIKNQLQSQTSNLSAYLYRKKPKYKFFSQLYFLFHISFTLCLFKVSGLYLKFAKI